jgi:hypothetical protein
VFEEEYPHPESRQIWEDAGRLWVRVPYRSVSVHINNLEAGANGTSADDFAKMLLKQKGVRPIYRMRDGGYIDPKDDPKYVPPSGC